MQTLVGTPRAALFAVFDVYGILYRDSYGHDSVESVKGFCLSFNRRGGGVSFNLD